MMAIIRVGYGSFVTTGPIAAITPVPPAYSPNDWLLYFTGAGIGNAPILTPAGWTLFSKNNLSKQISCFGLQGVGGDTIPSVTWGQGNAWAVIGVYRGLLLGDTVNIIDGALLLDKNGTSTKDIVGMVSAGTPTNNNSLVIQFGEKNKTSTSDSTVFTAPANFSLAASNVPAGAAQPAVAICEWIQTLKTTVPAAAIVGSVADSTAQNTQGSLFVLVPGVPPPGTGSSQFTGQTAGVVPAANTVLNPDTA